MLATCRQTLVEAGQDAFLVAAAACRLPFRASVFDLAMANHMLYEFTDPALVVTELTRVLRPEGRSWGPPSPKSDSAPSWTVAGSTSIAWSRPTHTAGPAYR
jgi:ubiquinone/menaquinone biosynthesis C-methylase UbiE